ncbi:uncharacterized protein LOC127081924 [Lathyrus oleraceus]|uniref:uncharacterized protein LOC127081924 n=1 Tax=Pisum sativum TaxID=3888 RepID=UPI0021CEA848|nr:uncharacterized protein LOC127081924 [Pisum sativum]
MLNVPGLLPLEKDEVVGMGNFRFACGILGFAIGNFRFACESMESRSGASKKRKGGNTSRPITIQFDTDKFVGPKQAAWAKNVRGSAAAESTRASDGPGTSTPGPDPYLQAVLPTNEQKEKPTQSAKSLSNWSGGSQYSSSVHNGKLEEPNDGYTDIPIPNDFLISNYDDPLEAIVSETYLNFLNNYKNPEFLQSRAILAGTIETVDIINQYVLGFIPGEEKEYLSSDSVDTFDGEGNEAFDVLTPEFLNTLTTSGLPNHKIKLKIGTPIMLLRNIDQPEGLCNGIRLIVTRLANHVIEAKIISGKNIGGVIYIPRMDMTPTQSP